MQLPTSGLGIYIAPGSTDMRKSVNGLSLIVEKLELELFTGNLFAFCSRSKKIIKILYWDRNGFCIWYKKLETEKFRWPNNQEEVMTIDHRQLSWLLEGLDLNQPAHKNHIYETIY